MDYERAYTELTSGQKKIEERRILGYRYPVKVKTWHRKLGWATYLDGPDEDQAITLTYRDAKIAYFYSDFIKLTLGAWRTLTTMRQVTEWTPFQAYSYDGYGFLSTPTKTRALGTEMKLSYDGRLLAGEGEPEPANHIDAAEFYSRMGPYVSKYIHNLVYGKIPEPVVRSNYTMRGPLVAELMLSGEQPGWLIDRAMRWEAPVGHQNLLPACWSENYWQWLKPKSRRRTAILYALELKGGRFPPDARPVLHYKLFKEHLTSFLLEAMGLEKIERPRQ